MNKNHAQNSSPKILKQSFKKTLLALALASFSTVCAADVQISRVTVNTQGEELNGDVWGKSLVSNTGDVVFASKATNLVDNDVTDNRYDLFLKNQLSGEVEFVNVHSDGTQGESDAYAFNMSPDGNMIVFRSNAYNLTDDPNSFYQHLYLRDRKTNQTLLVSKGFNGQAANGNSYDADVS
ncbi:MAG: hypothetical protein HRT35_25845, partial [Algicola sp.]|nr:hypothetical protein [Algicola sp.]